MQWWVVGSSVFMTSFSAWSFTGGAARAYETGTFYLVLFLCNVAGLIVPYFFTAERFRQMRIITKIEGVRKRFGEANEQIFAWLPLPFNIVMGGLALYTISVFMHAVFGFNLALLIVALSVTILVITVLRGAWAAASSDFVQLVLLLSITMVMVAMTLRHPQVGGLSGLIHKLPAYHFRWTLFERQWIVVFFCATLLANQVIQNNSMMEGAAKYVYVKNGLDAKKATLVSLFGFLILSPIWMIPALAAVILHPNLAAEFPRLNNPHEGAYVAMAISLLPRGLLGLLVSAVFAASVAKMTSMLSIGSGICVRNFWIRIVDCTASEERQVAVGRIFTLIYGLMWIGVAFAFATMKSLSLFDMLLLAAASVQIPTTVPLFLGMFVKRTPPWAGWSTMVAGFGFSLLLRFALTPELFTRVFSPHTPFRQNELGDLNIAATTATLVFVCTAWFFSTMLFYRKSDHVYVKRVDLFFRDMRTAIDPAEEPAVYATDSRQYLMMGGQCLIYGGFIFLLLLIPNPAPPRIAILCCGVLMAGTGTLLRVAGARLLRSDAHVVEHHSGSQLRQR
jgi:SSS family solute:Na+ symporter